MDSLMIVSDLPAKPTQDTVSIGPCKDKQSPVGSYAGPAQDRTTFRAQRNMKIPMTAAGHGKAFALEGQRVANVRSGKSGWSIQGHGEARPLQ